MPVALYKSISSSSSSSSSSVCTVYNVITSGGGGVTKYTSLTVNTTTSADT